MQLSIIIVNYNVKHYLELCLDSVFAAIQSLDAEVIVVDNKSEDQSDEMVARRFPQVIFISNTENLGFSKANNLGVEVAKGEYICILNPDTVVPETIFKNIFTFLDKQTDAEPLKKIGALGVRLVSGTGDYLPESKRNLPTPLVSFQKMIGNGKSYYADHVKEKEIGEVAVLVGAFMFIKRTVYLEVGGFDERYFMYGEDIDLSYTISQAGYTNFYLGEQTVLHFKGESTVKDKKYRDRFYGAMLLFYKKHLRKSFLEGLLVNAGLIASKFASRFKEQGNLSSQKFDDKVLEYYVDSNNNALYTAFAKAASLKTTQREKNAQIPRGSELIFDASSKEYLHIIEEISAMRNQGITFKIIPKNSIFAIGSNSSNGRGQVFKFESK